MSNTTKLITMSILTLAMVFSPLGAFAYPNQEGNFLDLKKAIVDINDEVITDIIFKAQGKIPINNPGINWGYGIITDVSGDLNVIATTSHPLLPVADSELQEDAADDVIHNHYVILGVDPSGLCGDNPFVSALTFESPGKIIVKHNEAILKNLPKSVTGGLVIQPPDIINDPNKVYQPGTDVQAAASFQLEYVEEEMNPDNFAICVTDVKALDPKVNSLLIIGEKDFDDKNQKPYGNEYNQDYGYSEEKPYGQYEYPDRNNEPYYG